MITLAQTQNRILPVFAGMIPADVARARTSGDSPRIRGDDPITKPDGVNDSRFSPYSRG